MAGTAAGDDVGPAVAVEVGGHEVLDRDPAVVEDVMRSNARGSEPGLGS